jgi:hypothetical protein
MTTQSWGQNEYLMDTTDSISVMRGQTDLIQGSASKSVVLSKLYGQAERAISIGKLNTLLRLHIRPINVIVFDGPSGRSHLEAGFALICVQRLS